MFSRPLRSALFHLGGRTTGVAANLRLPRTSPAVKQEDPWPVSASPLPGIAGSASSASRGGQPCAAPRTAAAVRGAERARRLPGETLSGAARGGGGKAGPFDLGTGWGLLGNGRCHCPLPLPSSQHQGARKNLPPRTALAQAIPGALAAGSSGAARLAERSCSLRAGDTSWPLPPRSRPRFQSHSGVNDPTPRKPGVCARLKARAGERQLGDGTSFAGVQTQAVRNCLPPPLQNPIQISSRQQPR